jgi:hypothetical protein
MNTQRRLLNKYAEFLSILKDAEISFKRKESAEKITEMNRIHKEIVILRKQLIREQIREERQDLQIKMKFRKR